MAEYINAISLDHGGNIYVAGTSTIGVYMTSEAEYLTIKYDASGNVYVTGQSDRFSLSGPPQPKLVTIKYSPSGTQQWVMRYPADHSWSGAPTLSLDGADNVFVGGPCYAPETGSDFIAVRYSTQGNLKWVARYNGPGNTSDLFAAMKMDNAGNIYVTGTRGINEWSVFTTVKYFQTLVDVKETTPLRFALERNYPNPFNPSTRISYQLPAVSNVSLKVYDVLGREVATLVDGTEQPGVNYHRQSRWLQKSFCLYKRRKLPWSFSSRFSSFSW